MFAAVWLINAYWLCFQNLSEMFSIHLRFSRHSMCDVFNFSFHNNGDSLQAEHSFSTFLYYSMLTLEFYSYKVQTLAFAQRNVILR